MASILFRLADAARRRVEESKVSLPLSVVADRATRMGSDTGFPFERALSKDGVSFICECKRASPSAGMIAPDYPYVDIAKEYESAGADAISVLTEPTKFLGSDRMLGDISSSVRVPCLRKDFVVDEYMIYQAKTLGASAVLLIAELLGEDDLRRYIGICRNLGMTALVEAHTAGQVYRAVEAGAGVIGVNNRDLNDFSVNLDTCLMLRRLVPDDVLFVAESGIRTREDVERLEEAGVDAVLVGGVLMESPDKASKLKELRGL